MLPHQAGEEEADGGCSPPKVQAVPAHGRQPENSKLWISYILGVFALHAYPRARTNTAAELFPQHTPGVMCWHSCSLGGTTMLSYTGWGHILGQWAKKYSLKRMGRKCWQIHIALDITALAWRWWTVSFQYKRVYDNRKLAKNSRFMSSAVPLPNSVRLAEEPISWP